MMPDLHLGSQLLLQPGHFFLQRRSSLLLQLQLGGLALRARRRRSREVRVRVERAPSYHTAASNTHFLLFLLLLHMSSSFPLDLVDSFKHLGHFPLSGGVVLRRPEEKKAK